MNSGFINRLVGTSIVVIAAIIFIPNILDGEKVHYKEGFKAIPERPEFKTIDLQEAIDDKVANAEQPSDDVIEDITSDDALLEEDANTVSEFADEPKVVTVTAGKEPEPAQATTQASREPQENLSKMAYVIQLGSFSNAANVKSLQAKLKAKGFKTFTRPVKTPNGSLTKVFVGPSLEKAPLQSKLPELKKLTKLNGRITQFKVTN